MVQLAGLCTFPCNVFMVFYSSNVLTVLSRDCNRATKMVTSKVIFFPFIYLFILFFILP